VGQPASRAGGAGAEKGGGSVALLAKIVFRFWVFLGFKKKLQSGEVQNLRFKKGF